MIGLFALLLSATPAHAGLLALSASGGSHYGTDQLWAGLDAAWHPDGSTGWAPTGRITPGYGFQDRRVLTRLEVGATYVVPRELSTTVRVGVIAGAVALDAPYRVPWELRDRPEHHFGLAPSMEGLVEFEYGEENLFVFGVRAGLESAASDYICATGQDQERCISWSPAFAGGFYGRGRIGKRLYLEGLLGPSPRLSVGVSL